MRHRIVLGCADAFEVVSEALAASFAQEPEAHDSLYLGEYDAFKVPEKVQVKHNYVWGMDDWDYPAWKGYAVLIVVEDTERPEYFSALLDDLELEAEVIEQKAW